MSTTELRWYVAHTRPRCEKKLAQYCRRKEFQVTLPCYRSVRKYRGKTLVFEKVLFPSYLFLQLLVEQASHVRQHQYLANLLTVVDQQLFEEQLGAILQALDSDVEVVLAPHISEGKLVRIKSGPLRGMEGFVQSREGHTHVLLRLDFIRQAAAVKMDATEVELV